MIEKLDTDEQKVKNAIKYVVTHGGLAHQDELAAVGLAMHKWGHVPCFRRDPTEEELLDPEVAVIDVGLQHNPEARNFDHHQFASGVEKCAFTLLAEHLGYAEVLAEHTRWYESMAVLDSRGPFNWAKKYGYKNFPFGLLGPIETGLRKRFEKFYGPKPVDPYITRLLMECVTEAVGEAMKIAAALDKVKDEAQHITLGGLPGIVYPHKDSTGLNEYYDQCKDEGLVLAFSITLDDRGDGWCLYRFGDHPEVDFTKLRDEPRVTFAHSGGFIAKTEDVGLQYAMELVERCVTRKKNGNGNGRKPCPNCGCADFVEGVACPNCD